MIKNFEQFFSDFVHSGLSKNCNIQDIARKHNVSVEEIENQVKIGIKIEYEHTSDIDIAEKIAKDHLYEHPKYYTGLVELEKELTQDEQRKQE